MDRSIRVVVVFLMTHIFLDFASSSISQSPVDTEVMIGHSTYLNCSTSDLSREIQWYHHPVGAETKDHVYVYTYGQMHPPYDKRFRIGKDKSSGSFDLVITNVELGDAGLYVCQIGGGTGQPSSAELVVLSSPPFCQTNVKSDGFIGPNTCDLQTDKVRLSCGVGYHGNIHPVLDWTNDRQKTQVFGIKPLCSNSDNLITCSVTLDAEINMDGSTFVCQTTRAARDQYRCNTDKAKVLYAVSEKMQIEKTVGDNVSCSATTNSPYCNYTWIWFDGVTETVISDDQDLQVEKGGWHRCEANCKINEIPCKVVPMLVNASSVTAPAGANDSKWNVIVAVVLTLIFCIGIAVSLGICSWKLASRSNIWNFREICSTLLENGPLWTKKDIEQIEKQLSRVEQIAATTLETLGSEHTQQNRDAMERNLSMIISIVHNMLNNQPDNNGRDTTRECLLR